MGDFPERDWKIFSSMTEAVYDRMYEKFGGEMRAILSDQARDVRARFFDAYEFAKTSRKEVDSYFGRHARSHAHEQILWMRIWEIMTDEEFARFSEPTREWVDHIMDERRKNLAEQESG